MSPRNQHEPHSTDLLTVSEAADYLRRSKRYIHTLIASGRLPAGRILDRGHHLVRRADLDRLIVGGAELTRTEKQEEKQRAERYRRAELIGLRLGYGKPGKLPEQPSRYPAVPKNGR